MPLIRTKEYELLEHILDCAGQQPAQQWTRIPDLCHSIPVESSETLSADIPGLGRVELAKHWNPGTFIYSLELHGRLYGSLLHAEDDPSYHNIEKLYRILERSVPIRTPTQATAPAAAAVPA